MQAHLLARVGYEGLDYWLLLCLKRHSSLLQNQLLLNIESLAIYIFEAPLIQGGNFKMVFGTAPWIQSMMGEYGLIFAIGVNERYHCFKLLSDVPVLRLPNRLKRQEGYRKWASKGL